MQQIADECGVTRKTLYNWLDDRLFDKELKKRIIRNTRNKLPEVTEAMVAAVTEDHNAAMAKLVLQMNDMLTDAVNVSDKLETATDIDAMQERIAAYKKRNGNSSE
ncbi:phBC6A51 family helix-turn-helix protein [Ornithinibacillus sp. JPR2-1]|uniref:phBC6A51 family helix-turn-helix protein n=1 Tax=Ornithinibacillus sp. JPR2-1 TaxID=2094019 RepID=UPI0031D331B7